MGWVTKIRSGVAAALVLSGGLGATSLAQMQRYEGVARIGNLDQVTIVYPSAATSPEQLRVAQDSAALRGSYLAERYGVAYEIAADNVISEEQLQGHLLLLGWDNALIGTEAAPYPWRRTEAGFSFAGANPVPGDPDLLFMALSPYNKERYMAFWSRISPELDRLLTFPFVGSDWAVYDDYLIVQQGMFAASVWPPARNPYAEKETVREPVSRRQSSEHYVLYAADETLDATQATAILQARERAWNQAAEFIGEPDDARKIDLFVYPSIEVKHEQTGVADAVHTIVSRQQLHMPLNYARTPNPREELHLLAHRQLGPCSLMAFYEGLAFTMEHRQRREELTAFVGLLNERGADIDLTAVLDNEKLRKSGGQDLGLATAGLLVHWIDSVYGRDALRQAYPLAFGDAVPRLAQILGVEDAEAAFEGWIRSTAKGTDSVLAYRRALARADQRGHLGDFAGRAQALAEAIELRPEDPQLPYQLALSQIEAGLYDAARTGLEALVERAPEHPSYLVPFSLYHLGRLHERDGDPEQAAKRYEAVLELPDDHGSHEKSREALTELRRSAQ